MPSPGRLLTFALTAAVVIVIPGPSVLFVVGRALAGGRRVAAADWRSFLQGLTVGLTNPKTVVFLAAILPQFASRGAGNVAGQILVLGLVFAAIALVSDTSWACAAGAFRSWFARSPRRLEAVGAAGGLAIVAVGAGLLVSGRRS